MKLRFFSPLLWAFALCSVIGLGQTLSVSPNSLTFENMEEQKTFQIRSDVNWMVRNDASWLTVSPSSGRGNSLVRVTTANNEEITQRTATINVSSNQVPGLKRVNITQSPSPAPGLQATWLLSPTMTATLNNGVLTVSTSKDAEAMPNNINPWYDFRVNIFTAIIEDKVTSIGDQAFRDCANMTFVLIPNSVTTIGASAFYNCSRLVYIPIPNSVTTIGIYAFWSCYGLTSIEISKSVTAIGARAFSSCYGLTSIEIPKSVTSIGAGAFSSCYGLTSIEIPKSVTSIGDNAFSGILYLKDIKVEWSTPLPVPANVFGYETINNCTLHVPAGTKSLYLAASTWNQFESIVEYSPTDTESIEIPTLKAFASNGILNISGLKYGMPIDIYSINGQIVYKGVANNGTEQIPLNEHGIFIIISANQSIKVVVE